MWHRSDRGEVKLPQVGHRGAEEDSRCEESGKGIGRFETEECVEFRLRHEDGVRLRQGKVKRAQEYG